MLIQKSGRFGIVASPKRKRSRRSFKLELSKQNTCKSVSSNSIGPLTKEIPEAVDNLLLFTEQNKKNFLWAIIRHHFSDSQDWLQHYNAW